MKNKFNKLAENSEQEIDIDQIIAEMKPYGITLHSSLNCFLFQMMTHA